MMYPPLDFHTPEMIEFCRFVQWLVSGECLTAGLNTGSCAVGNLSAEGRRYTLETLMEEWRH